MFTEHILCIIFYGNTGKIMARKLGVAAFSEMTIVHWKT